MNQRLYICIFAALLFYLPTLGSEHHQESKFTFLMPQSQLITITLEKEYGYTLDRSQVSHVADTSFENNSSKVESYLAVFHREGLVTYSYFHEGTNAGQLLVFLEDPRKKPLKGNAADFNYLKKRYLESKTQK